LIQANFATSAVIQTLFLTTKTFQHFFHLLITLGKLNNRITKEHADLISIVLQMILKKHDTWGFWHLLDSFFLTYKKPRYCGAFLTQ
jgi:hypothetical protein